MIVFERDVSDLFFSNVPADAAEQISSLANGGARRIQCSSGSFPAKDHPIITCFGVILRLTRAFRRRRGLQAIVALLRSTTMTSCWARGQRSSYRQLGSQVRIGHATFHVIGVLKTANGFEDGGVFHAACRPHRLSSTRKEPHP